MKRTDLLDGQPGSLFQKILYLHAKTAYNTKVIAAGTICPGFLFIKGTEFTKAICREQNLIAGIIGHHDFWPVNHGSCHKGKLMSAKT